MKDFSFIFYSQKWKRFFKFAKFIIKPPTSDLQIS